MADRLRKALAERDAAVRRRGKGNITSKGFFNALEQAANFAIPFTPDNIRWMREMGERIRSGDATAEDYMSAVAIGAVPIGGRFAPKTPGLKAEILEPGDQWIGYDSFPQTHSDYSQAKGERVFNLRNEADEIVGSVNRRRPSKPRTPFGRTFGKPEVYVPEMWIRDDYRKSPALFDMYRLVSHGGRFKTRATFANPKLARVHAKLGVKQAKERVKELRAQGLPEDSNVMRIALNELDDAQSNLRIEAPRGRREQRYDPGTPELRDSELSDLADIDDVRPMRPTPVELDDVARSPLNDRERAAARASLARQRARIRPNETRRLLNPEVLSQLGARGGAAGGLLGRRLAQHDPLDAAALVERGSVPRVPDVPPEACAMRRQVTNRDVPSLRQMAPVRRAPVPRPAVVDPIVARAQDAQEQLALRHAMQAARVSEIQRSVAALRRRGGR